VMGTQMAYLTGLNRNTVNRYSLNQCREENLPSWPDRIT
jgi:hypothetical protein